MTRTVAILLLAFIFGCQTTSNIKQPNKNYFVKYFGGDGNQKAVGLIANDDGTFYILGNSRSSTNALQQVYLAKASAVGDTIWQTTYGNVEMDARDFKVANGSIVVVANRKANANSSNSDIQLIQFNLKGDSVQSKVLQLDPALTITHYNTWANSVTVMNDGGFLVTGYTDYTTLSSHIIDALHFRTDANFNQKLGIRIWNSSSGTGIHNFAAGAFQTGADSTYIFGYTDGPTQSTKDDDFWAFTLDTYGDQHGVETFAVNNSDDELTNAIKTTSGGYLLSGLAIDDNSNNFSLKISKIRYDNLSYDSKKDIQFTYSGRSLGRGGTIKYATACNSVDGYFALTNTFNSGGLSDILLVKLDLTLQETWSNPVTLGGDGDDTAAAVAELPDGHIMVLGTINLGNPPEQFKIALMKLNSAGKLAD